jgi:hypothetical protein
MERAGIPGGGETAKVFDGDAELAPIATTLPFQITGDFLGSGEVPLTPSPVSYVGAESMIRDSAKVVIAGETGLDAAPINVARSLITDFIRQSQKNFDAQAQQAQQVEQATIYEATEAAKEPVAALEVAPASAVMPAGILGGFVELNPPVEPPTEIDVKQAPTELEIEDYLRQIASFLADQSVTFSPEASDSLILDETTEPAPKLEFRELTGDERAGLFGGIASLLAAQESISNTEVNDQLSAEQTTTANEEGEDDYLHELPPGIVVSLTPNH